MGRPEVPMTNRRSRVPPEHRLLTDLCLENSVDFHRQGPGLLLIGRSGIERILDDLSHQGVGILGLDGFELDGADLDPRLDLIFDSDRSGPRTARDVLADWPDNVWIDVTLGRIS